MCQTKLRKAGLRKSWMAWCLLAIFSFVALAETQLESSSLPEAGKHQTQLNVTQQGRYRLQVKSQYGMSIQVIDVMAGILGSQGEAGKHDGYLDLVLESGTYLVEVEGVPDAKEKATLQLIPFEEKHSELKPLPPISTTESLLADLEQRSFLLVLEKAQVFRAEIMGRFLEDAVLWREDGWSTGLKPTRSTFEPNPGKPMLHLEFHHSLPPGKYLLTLYGGKGQSWSVNDPSRPLYLRWDPRVWGPVGAHEITISAFGKESFLINGDTNYFEVTRDDVAPTTLRRIQLNNVQTPRYQTGGYYAVMDAKAKNPKLSLRTNTLRKPQWVVVEGRPGDQIRLRYFPRSYYAKVEGNQQKQYIGTLHSHDVLQSLGMTGILQQKQPAKFLQTQLLNISGSAGWWRQIDLQSNQQAWLRVSEAGSYIFSEANLGSATAQYQIKPFNASSRNRNVQPFRNPGQVFDLAAGIYQLTIKPKRKGVLNVGMHLHSKPAPFQDQSILPQVQTEIAWADVGLSANNQYQFYLPLVASNLRHVFQEDWPLKLQNPIPLVMLPKENRRLEINLEKPRRLSIGQPLRLMTDNGSVPQDHLWPAGTHTVLVENPSDRTAIGTFAAWDWDASPSAVPRAEKQSLKRGGPLYVNMNQNDRRQFVLTLEESGIYRIETIGRAATNLTVHGRTRANVYSAIKNGWGRNATIHQYFKAGEYVVDMSTLDETKGRIGLQVTKNTLRNGGKYSPQQTKRIALKAGEAVVYDIHIEEQGFYSLETLGLGKSFTYRFETDKGWPAAPTQQSGLLEIALEPGHYRYYSLPSAVASRRVTSMTKKREPKILEGKGPHLLTWDQTQKAIWREGNPDIYSFTLKAPTTVSLEISPGMVGEINGVTQKIFGGEPWSQQLDAQTYHLTVKRLEPDDFFHYSIHLTANDLIPSTSKVLSGLVQSIPVSIGQSGLLDFEVTGPSDTRLELRRSQNGAIIQTADDTSNDWNPKLTTYLNEGRYYLKVYPVGASFGKNKISLRQRQEKQDAKKTLPFKVKKTSAFGVYSTSFQLKQDSLVNLKTNRGVTLSLSHQNRTIAQQNGSMTIPLKKERVYFFRAWTTQEDQPLEVTVGIEKTRSLPLEKSGYRLSKKRTYRLQTSQPLTYRYSTQQPIFFSPGFEQPMERLTQPILNMAMDQGWLRGSGSFKLTPLTIKNTEPLSLITKEAALTIGLETQGPGVVHIESVDPFWRASLTAKSSSLNPWGNMILTDNGLKVAIGSAGKHTIYLWRQDSPHSTSSLQFRVQLFETTTPNGQTPSSTMFKVTPNQVLTLKQKGLTKGILLSKNMIALGRNNQTTSGLWATTDRADAFNLASNPSELMVFNPNSTPGFVRLIQQHPPVPETSHQLAQTSPFEHRFEPGSTLLSLQMPEEMTLHAYGKQVSLEFFGDNGFYFKGTPPFSIPSTNGTAKVTSKSGGWLQLSVSSEPDMILAQLNIPSSINPLPKQAFQLTHKHQAYEFALTEPRFVSFSVNQPTFLTLISNNQLVASGIIDEHGESNLSHLLKPGTYQLITKAMSFTTLAGELNWQQFQPQPITNEQAQFIANNESHVFQFQLNETTKVGLGIKTDAEHLSGKLFNSKGVLIAFGSVLVQDLHQGQYYFVVQNQASPVLYQPLFYGLQGNKTQIPDHILEQYYQP